MVPVLFQNSLKRYEEDTVANLDHIVDVEPMKISSPSTDAEVALALRVLEGCCLLHRESTIFAHQHKAIEVFTWASFVHCHFLFLLMVNMLQPLFCLILYLFTTFILHDRQKLKLSDVWIVITLHHL